MSYILILGAKSDISKSLAKLYAKKGFSLYLAGRNINKLDNFSYDLAKKFNIKINLIELNILDFTSHKKKWA